jgi:cell division protein FtsI/penicillin-binding protein 2
VPAKRPIVVAVTVERGGFGAAVAAPIACRILAKYYSQDVGACAAGTAKSR